ncbi:MAG: hypothetical protein IJX14_08020 [Clostridia bacterium]|nr:hypothetical protein [Clostridia bacterium]
MKYSLPAALALCLLLPGCAADPTPAYDPSAFTCTLAIDSVSTGENGYFGAAFSSENGMAVLTVTSPERLAGLTFSFTEAGCAMEAGGVMIPLSREASASLTTLADLLCAAPESALDRKKTADGTVLVFDSGRLTLNGDGLPVLAETTDGRRALLTMHPAGVMTETQ